ncbi:MAG: DUF6152 family protein [Pseudomonadales bacterium]|nr:DUF6152 family protein [Pseudomonadales bacterium]
MTHNARLLALTSLLAMLFCVPAFAHHSFQASYDMDRIIRIKGQLVQMNFRNPHSSIMVMAPDDNGVMQRWGVEWGGASLLQRQGLSRDSFKPGDEVVITGQPGRNAGDHRLRMQSIVRPLDGFGWGTKEGESFD